MSDQETEIQAAVFRKFIAHLQAHPEAQNIDLMILADFCRNCLSKWYVSEAAERGLDVDLEAAHQVVYGMSYAEWKANHQLPATPEQLAAFQARKTE